MLNITPPIRSAAWPASERFLHRKTTLVEDRMDTPQTEETEIPQIVNLSQVSAEIVQAGLVRASQTAIQQLSAEEVDLQTSVVGAIQTGEIHAHDSIIGGTTSHKASLDNSLVGGIRTDSISFNGVSALIIGNSMTNNDVHAIAMIATDIQADTIQTGILFSREVHGNVTTTLDGRTALMVGVVGGAVAGLILLAGKLLFGRKN